MKRRAFISLVLLYSFAVARGQDIFEAARGGNVARIESLIAIKADTVNSRNASDFTPLVIAVYRNQPAAVKLLLQHGAEVDANSPEGPALLSACYKGNLELTNLLISYKANVNAMNDSGTSALMYAALSGNVDLVKLLVNAGAKKDQKEKSGRTALNYAQMGNSHEITAMLSE